MPIEVRKGLWAAEVGQLNGLDTAREIAGSWPLEKPHRIAAALSDSNVSVRVQESARVRGDAGEFERKMRLAERFLLPWAVLHARERAEAMGPVEVRADADLGTVTARADRRRAELRHVSSIGSCSTLLTKVGPAIVLHRVAAAFSAPHRVDDQAMTSDESLFAKRRIQKRAFMRGRKRERSQHVPLRADADVAVSICAGSRGGRWQGHLSFICPPFLSKMRSDEAKGPLGRMEARLVSFKRWLSVRRREGLLHLPASFPFWPSSTPTANRTGGYLLTCPILLYLPIHPPGVQTHPPVLIPHRGPFALFSLQVQVRPKIPRL